MTAPRSLGFLPSAHPRVALLDDPADDREHVRVVDEAATRLAAEFPDRRTSSLTDVVDRCRRDLAGAPPGALPELLERLARQRLHDGASE